MGHVVAFAFPAHSAGLHRAVCLPTLAAKPPSGPGWIHEIKHDGFRSSCCADDRVLIAFDLLELDGEDTRREPIEGRKKALEKLLRRTAIGIEYNQHLEDEDGPRVLEHACRLGFEGIVSKRRGSRYQSGRCHRWLSQRTQPRQPRHEC